MRFQILVTLILLVVVTSTYASGARKDCKDLLESYIQKQNKMIDDQELAVSKKKIDQVVNRPYEISKLGEGIGGGIVYRLTFSNNETKIIKLYREQESLINDFYWFSYINRSLKVEGVSVVQSTLNLDHNVLLMNDTRGVTLRDFLQDSNIDKSIKLEMVNRFNGFNQNLSELIYNDADLTLSNIESLKTTVKDHPLSGEDNRDIELLMLRDSFYLLKDTPRHIYTHSDNFIVTTNLDLVLIDPY